MSFDEKFKLLELKEDKDAKTFKALHIPSSRNVTVFLFPGQLAGKHADFLEKLRQADQVLFPEIIETGDNRGTPYIATEFNGSFSELKENLQSRLLTATKTSSPRKTDEFTKVGVWRVPPLLHSASKPEQEHSASQTARPTEQVFADILQPPAPPIGETSVEIPSTSAPAQPQTTQPQPEPGEFTRLFQTAAPPIGETPVEIPSTSAPAQPQTTQPQPEPGEFTRLFRAARGLEETPQKPPIQEPRGEFTRLFGSGDLGSTVPSSSTQILNAAQAPQAMGQKPSESSLPTLTSDGRAGEFTRLFGGSTLETPRSENVPAQPARVPGEYTQIFQAQACPAAAPEETPPVPDQAASKAVSERRVSYIVPVLIGVILLLLATLVVILITMSK